MGASRWAPLAEIPTLREQGFDVVEGSMRGIAAPAGLPLEVLARLALSVERTVADPDFQASAAQQNLPLRFLPPPAFLDELEALRRHYQALWQQHPWREG
jgi:tripartite-type tricarboxylate transporter receptor subunit TctC